MSSVRTVGVGVLVIALFLLLAHATYRVYNERDSSVGSSIPSFTPRVDVDDDDHTRDRLRDKIAEQLRVKVIEATKNVISATRSHYPNSEILRQNLELLVQVAIDSASMTVEHVGDDLSQIDCANLTKNITHDIEVNAQQTLEEYEIRLRDEQDIVYAAIRSQATRSFGEISKETGLATVGQIGTFMNNMVDVHVNSIMMLALQAAPDVMIVHPTLMIDNGSRDIEQFVWDTFKQHEAAIIALPQTTATNITGATVTMAHSSGGVVRVTM